LWTFEESFFDEDLALDSGLDCDIFAHKLWESTRCRRWLSVVDGSYVCVVVGGATAGLNFVKLGTIEQGSRQNKSRELISKT
jgi:hypothetical protein